MESIKNVKGFPVLLNDDQTNELLEIKQDAVRREENIYNILTTMLE